MFIAPLFSIPGNSNKNNNNNGESDSEDGPWADYLISKDLTVIWYFYFIHSYMYEVVLTSVNVFLEFQSH